MAEITENGQITQQYSGDDGRVVQLQKSDGSNICYFPITLCHAVFNDNGASLHDVLTAFSAKLNVAIKSTDKIKFTKPSSINENSEITSAGSGEFGILGDSYTIEELFYMMQQWGKLIDKKASAYNVSNTGTIIAAHKAVQDGSGNNIVETYARKDDVNKAIQVKGSVPTLAYLHGLADVKPGYMYTISYDPNTFPEGSPEETFQVYYESTDSGERELIEGPLITVDDGAAFIYTGLYDEIYGTKEFGANDGNWMFSGSDIDYSKFAEKEFTPYVLIGPKVPYNIDLSDLFK